MHDVGDPQQQAPAQAAAGVGEREVFRAEAAGFQQGHGQGIAHHQGGGGTGGGGQAQGAGFNSHADIQVGNGLLGQDRVGVAGHADQRSTHALDQGQDGNHFAGAATVGDGNDHILRGNHAHVAVAGFAGVDKE